MKVSGFVEGCKAAIYIWSTPAVPIAAFLLVVCPTMNWLGGHGFRMFWQ